MDHSTNPHSSTKVNAPHNGDSDSDLDIFDAEHGDIAAPPISSVVTTGPAPSSSSFRSPSNPNLSTTTSDHALAQSLAREHLNEKTLTPDWSPETPGQRLPPAPSTYIDWLYEHSRERHHTRTLLASSSGLTRTLLSLRASSTIPVWLTLLLTGLLVGLLAFGITVFSDWLGDIKTGYCHDANEATTQFYLSKQFCCWGYSDLSHCRSWTPWRRALGIENIGGAYVTEYVFFVLFAVSFAVSAAVLVKTYAPFARQSGIPELKTVLGGYMMGGGFLSSSTLGTKVVGVCLAVASGLWLGKEGPLVHIACCCAELVMKPFAFSANEAKKREVLSAAAAAGISVAFGAPIGGVLFSLEQLAYYFPDRTMWQAFVCAMVAAVTLQALNPFHTGKIVLYQVTYTTGWHDFEMVPFVMLGIIGGIFGTVFIKLNVFIAKVRNSEMYPLRNRPILEVALTSFLVAMINFPNLFMRAQLSELVYYLFAECATIGNNDIFGLCKVTVAGSLSMVSLLITAAGLGTILAAVTFGLPLPAGIILPSLTIGALYGRALGVLAELFHRHHTQSLIFAACEPDVPCITPGTYAIVGAASALAGATRMTASIVVIMFELTGALTYVLPIMIAVMLSKWIADAFSPKGIYESWIQLREYPYVDNRDDVSIPQVGIDSVMTKVEEMAIIDAGRTYSVEDLKDLLKTSPYRGYPVLRTKSNTGGLLSRDPSKNTLLGYISRTELAFALEHESKDHTPRNSVSARTLCYFARRSEPEAAPPSGSIDMRPWMDQTPITLHAASSLQLAVSMFQKLGLRYLLFTDKGAFKGLLTKKDIWWILNASDQTMAQSKHHSYLEDERDQARFIPGAGALRNQSAREGRDLNTVNAAEGEEEGLLRDAG